MAGSVSIISLRTAQVNGRLARGEECAGSGMSVRNESELETELPSNGLLQCFWVALERKWGGQLLIARLAVEFA